MKTNKNNFIERANEIHKNKYDYSKSEYINSQTKVCIICPEHGEFWQTPASHIRGYGCPECANLRRSIAKKSEKWEKDNFIKRANEIHNNKYDYSKIKYINSQTKVCIICPEHGEFWQTPLAHIFNKNGCPKCSGRQLSTEEIIEIFRKKHRDKYDYSKVVYNKMHEKVCIICPEHGEFWQTPSKHILGQGCPKCGKLNCQGCPKCENNMLLYRDEITDFLEQYGLNIKKKETEVLVTDYNLVIEFNDLYWCNETYKNKNYRLNKTIEYENKNIKLVHIFEDEWRNKKDIIQSLLLDYLGLTTNIIELKYCTIKVVDKYEKIDFLNRCNLFGNTSSDINIGLYYGQELVSIMTFKKKSSDSYELVRFCNKLNTKIKDIERVLFNYFIVKYKPNEIIGSNDRRWPIMNIYEKLGFKKNKTVKPNFYYIEGNNRNDRLMYRKRELIKRGIKQDKKEYIKENNIFKIYDCGLIEYVWMGEN